MKLIWTGTDSLLLRKFPKQMRFIEYWYVIKIRLFARWADRKVQAHYYCGDLVKSNLRDFGMKKPIEKFIDPVQYSRKLEKISHEGFNILYYYPWNHTPFKDWIYGYDIYRDLKQRFEDTHKDINFIYVFGSTNMRDIFPMIDLYIRPNRHDGHPRLIDECIIQDIPYLHTFENPDLQHFIINIKQLYEAKHKIHLNQ